MEGDMYGSLKKIKENDEKTSYIRYKRYYTIFKIIPDKFGSWKPKCRPAKRNLNDGWNVGYTATLVYDLNFELGVC